MTIRPVLTDGNFVVENPDNTETVTYDISITGYKTDSLVTVAFKVGAGLTDVAMKHGDAAMTAKGTLDEVAAADDFYYDAVTAVGVVPSSAIAVASKVPSAVL